jgi:hypothetical protein
MKHIRRFNDSLKENSKYQESPIVFVGAHSRGIIEYGDVHIYLQGDDLYIIIEQYSDGREKFLLDNLDYKEKLESFGIEIDGEEIVGPREFLSDLHSFYDGNSRL